MSFLAKFPSISPSTKNAPRELTRLWSTNMPRNYLPNEEGPNTRSLPRPTTPAPPARPPIPAPPKPNPSPPTPKGARVAGYSPGSSHPPHEDHVGRNALPVATPRTRTPVGDRLDTSGQSRLRPSSSSTRTPACAASPSPSAYGTPPRIRERVAELRAGLIGRDPLDPDITPRLTGGDRSDDIPPGRHRLRPLGPARPGSPAGR